MKILIFSRFMYPQNTPRAFRVDELARSFVRMGHCVAIVCDVRDFDFDEYRKKTGVVVNVFKRGSTKFLFSRKYVVGKISNQIMNYVFKYPEIKYVREVYAYLKEKHDYDLIITNAVPHGIHWGAALFLCLHRRIKDKIRWIAECGDPFTGNPTIKKAFYFKYMERFAFRQADFITIPVEEAKAAYASEFQSKIKIIPQGYDFSKIELLPYKANKIVTFVYAGSFHRHIRNPRKVINYLIKEVSIPFKFFIYTNNVSHDIIRDLIVESKGSIVCKDLVPRKELIKRMSSADFLLNLSNYSASAQIPSKLIDYSLAKRPILNLSPVDFNKNSLLCFLNREYRDQLKIDLTPYSIDVVSKQFLDLK